MKNEPRVLTENEIEAIAREALDPLGDYGPGGDILGLCEEVRASREKIALIEARHLELYDTIADLSRQLDECHQHGAALSVDLTKTAEDRSHLREERDALLKQIEDERENHNAWLEAHNEDWAAIVASTKEVETSATIADWANATFGPSPSNMSTFLRASKEWNELIEKLQIDDMHPGIPEEIADQAIVFARILTRFGTDLQVEIDRKMKINRARKWKLTGDGHGQHVEEGE